MRYEVARSVQDKSVHVIFHEGTFETLPQASRDGPVARVERR